MRFQTYQGRIKPTTISEYGKLSDDPNVYGGGSGLKNIGSVMSGIGAEEHKKLKQKIEQAAAEEVAKKQYEALQAMLENKWLKKSDVSNKPPMQDMSGLSKNSDSKISGGIVEKHPYIVDPVGKEEDVSINPELLDIYKDDPNFKIQFYDQVRQGEQSATNVIYKTNEFQELINKNLVVSEGKINFEEEDVKLGEIEKNFVAIRDIFNADSKSFKAADSLLGAFYMNARRNYKDILVQKFLAEEDKERAAIFEESVEFAMTSIDPNDVESIFGAVLETDKQLYAMFGMANSFEEMNVLSKEKNKTIVGGAINNLLVEGKTDSAFEVYDLALQNGLLTEEDLMKEAEGVVEQKTIDIYEAGYQKYLDDGAPEDMMGWLNGQNLNIILGQGEWAVPLEVDQEDYNNALKFMNEKKQYDEITKIQDRRANKKLFQKELETAIAEGQYEYSKGLSLAKSIAKDEEEYEILKQDVDELSIALESKENAELANKPIREIMIDVCGKLISGKFGDKHLLALSMLTSNKQIKGLMTEFRGMVKSAGNIAGTGILSYQWSDKKDNIKEIVSQFGSIDDEKFEEIYDKAMKEVAKQYIEKALNRETMTEFEMDEMIGGLVIEGTLVKNQEQKKDFYNNSDVHKWLGSTKEKHGFEVIETIGDDIVRIRYVIGQNLVEGSMTKKELEYVYNLDQQMKKDKFPEMIDNKDGTYNYKLENGMIYTFKGEANLIEKNFMLKVWSQMEEGEMPQIEDNEDGSCTIRLENGEELRIDDIKPEKLHDAFKIMNYLRNTGEIPESTPNEDGTVSRFTREQAAILFDRYDSEGNLRSVINMKDLIIQQSKMNFKEGSGGGEPENYYGPKSEKLGEIIHTREGWFQLQIEEGLLWDTKKYVPIDTPVSGTKFWEKDYSDPQGLNGSYCIKGDGINTKDVYLSDSNWQENRNIQLVTKNQYGGFVWSKPDYDYGPRTRKEGEIVYTKNGWFVIKKERDGFLGTKNVDHTIGSPESGTIFWKQNDDDHDNGWYYIKGDGINTKDTYTGKDSEQMTVKPLATKDQLIAIGWKGEINDAMLADLNRVMGKYEINTPARKRHFFSQCLHETDEGTAPFESDYGDSTYYRI